MTEWPALSRQLRLIPLIAIVATAACAEGVLEETGAYSGSEVDGVTPDQALEIDGHATVLSTRLVPEVVSCVHRGETPLTPEEAFEAGFDDALTRRQVDVDEVSGGLPTADVERLLDRVELSPSVGMVPQPRQVAMFTVNYSAFLAWMLGDADGDCASNGIELSLGTDANNPDTDGDGWYDGACNERRRLYVEWIKAYDEQEDWGDDEHYLVVDDIRHPSGDLDDYWNFDDGQSRSPNRLVAERTRGTNVSTHLRNVRIEGWEDDVELVNTWWVDDLLYTMDVDLGAHADGEVFTIRRTYSDWDYEIRFRVDVEHFADPNPLVDGDSDGDGILESAESRTARGFGGITDPEQPDILVEVDWMSGHGLSTRAKRLVNTQLYRHGYHPYIHRHQSLPVDGCLTRTEAVDLYNSRFTFAGYGSFRYALITEVIFNDASGVAIGDTFLMDDSTWWINGGTLPQAATFLHELGHTMGLTQSLFHLIDTIAWLSYDSTMNYTYQATMVDYSNSGAGGSSNDHNDWAAVNPAYGMSYSFGLSTAKDDGVCN